jgi:enoyl-CoA hydratase/carnithine racemase
MADILLSERIADHTHLLTLNRPEQLNAMTADLCAALHAELDRLANERSCRAIVLTGAGRGFCAGVDLRGYGQAPGNTGTDPARDHFGNQEHMSRLIHHLRATPQPVIAAVNGPAAGCRHRFRAGAGRRHPVCRTVRRVPLCVRQHRSLQLRHGNELAPSTADRRLACSRTELTARRVSAEEASRIGLVAAVVVTVLSSTARSRARGRSRSGRPGPSGSPSRQCGPRSRSPLSMPSSSTRTANRSWPSTDKLRLKRYPPSSRSGRLPSPTRPHQPP